MPEESHGLFHFGKKDEEAKETPQSLPPPEEHHSLLHIFDKQEAPPPPPPEKHGLLENVEHLLGKQEAPPPPPPPPENLWRKLFHRKPVTPEPAAPQRPALLQHHSFRSALYILGTILLISGLIPGIVDDAYRFPTLAGGAILLIGGILLTGDWHPLTGMLGLRQVHLPPGTALAAKLAQREVKSEVQKLTGEDEPAQPLRKRLAPWHWPWSARAAEPAEAAEQAKTYKHVGLGGKLLMGIMTAILGHGALTLVQAKYLPSDLSSFASFARPTIILASILLILFIITAHIPTRRTHWLSPFGILRRVLIFFVVAALAALVAGLLTHDPERGNAYGQIIGAIAAILAVLL